MQGGNFDAIANGPSDVASNRGSVKGKFTLTIECLAILKPDTTHPGIYISKSAEEAAEHLQLRLLLPIPTLSQIKIKLFHICGPIEFDEGSCLTALWGVGDWLVEQYREIGKPAHYERVNRGREDDWIEPDATLDFVID